jgi:glycosyltransferase involved in cell wall biosynthesis
MKSVSPAGASSVISHPAQSIRKMCLVSETWLPEINGVAMTLSNLANGLLQRGWQVTVIRPRQRMESSQPVIERLHHFLIPGLPIPGYAGLRFGLPVTSRLKAEWKVQRPDVVHVATEGPLGWAAMKAADSLGIPVTTTFHTNFHNYCGHYRIGWLQGLVTRYLRVLHNRAKYTMVPSQTSKNVLQEEGYRNVEVLGRGVDVELYHPSRRDEQLRSSWGASPQDIVAIYVGRMAAEKNLDVVAQTFAKFQQMHPTAKMVWVGNGPEYKKLRQQYPQHFFAGAKTGIDLAKHYASADLFIFPSLTETYGNVVTEAMASGLAVVAYDYAAASTHIKHLENGLLAPFNDLSAFMQNVQYLATHPALIKKLGLAAHPALANQSWASVCDVFEGFLEDAISSPSLDIQPSHLKSHHLSV